MTRFTRTLLPMAASVFTLATSHAQTPASWLLPVDGNWRTGTAWSTQPTFPNNTQQQSYAAAINASGASYRVTLDSQIRVDSIALSSPDATLLLDSIDADVDTPLIEVSAGTLEFQRYAQLRNARITGSGGTVVFSSPNVIPAVLRNVTLARSVGMGSDRGVLIPGTLTLDSGTLEITGARSRVEFEGDGTLAGHGQIVLHGSDAQNRIIPAAGASLTISPGITIRTGNSDTSGGTIGAIGARLINQGTILSQRPSGQNATPRISITGTDWTNQGTLIADGGDLQLQGALRTAGLGTIVTRNGGVARMQAALDNTGAVLDIAQFGSFSFAGGTISGGLITSSDSLLKLRGFGALRDVNLGVDLEAPSSGSTGRLSGTIDFSNNASIRARVTNDLLATGTTELRGIGSIVFSDDGLFSGSCVVGGSSLTIGSGITVATTAGSISGANLVSLRAATFNGNVLANSPGTRLTLDATTWTNNGTMIAGPAAGTLSLLNQWTNTGLIRVAPFGTLVCNGTWSNSGTIEMSNATLRLGRGGLGMDRIFVEDSTVDVAGTVTLAQLNAIQRTNIPKTRIVTGGLLDVSGQTLQPSGIFTLLGGTIRGGTFQTAGGGGYTVFEGQFGTFSGMAIRSPIHLLGGSVRFRSAVIHEPVTVAPPQGAPAGVFLDGTWSNQSSIQLNGGNLTLAGVPLALGSISLTDANFTLSTPLTTAQLDSIPQTRTMLILANQGTLDNRNSVLPVSSNRKLTLAGGAIVGGRVETPDQSIIETAGSSGEAFIQGITLASPIQLRSSLFVRDGLTLDHARILMDAPAASPGLLRFVGSQTVSGVGTIDMTSDNQSSSSVIAEQGFIVTLGPGITAESITPTSAGRFGTDFNTSLFIQSTVRAANGGFVGLSGNVRNDGLFNADGGRILWDTNARSLNLEGNTLRGGRWRVAGGGELRLDGATPIRVNEAEVSLDGSSALFAAFDSLNENRGIFSIAGGRQQTLAGNLANSGILQIALDGSRLTAASVNLTDSGVLDFVLFDSQWAGLVCSQPIELNGALRLSLSDGFSPQFGQTFVLVQYPGATGSFDSVQLPPLPAGLELRVDLQADRITATVVPEPIQVTLFSFAAAALARRRRMV